MLTAIWYHIPGTFGIQATVQGGANVILGESTPFGNKRKPSNVAPSSCKAIKVTGRRAPGSPLLLQLHAN